MPIKISLKSWWPISLVSVAFFMMSCAARTTPVEDADDEYYRSPDAVAEASPEQEARVTAVESSETSLVLVMSARVSSGSLDEAAVGLALVLGSDQLAGCYDDLGDQAAGRGVVYLLLDVEPTGEVSDVMVGHSAIRDRDFVSCLSSGMRGVRMPTSESDAVVQAHLVFGADNLASGRELFQTYRAQAESDGDEATPVGLAEVGRRARQCFERTFRGRRLEQGRLVLDLTVSGEGRIDEVEVVEDDFDGRLDVCVAGSVRHLQLVTEGEPPERIRYPVILSAPRDDPNSVIAVSGGK
jgi:hypothetical protein